ncbi:hypothetical protein IMSAGC019_00847 [Lachnospiraceae bacterium]|nr:hypothetical protein IMSAGC019_00847 [Lachnospiraceae bacterium]
MGNGYIQSWMKKNKNTLAFLLGIASIFAGFSAWCFFTISYKGILFKWVGALATLLTAMFYSGTMYLVKENENISKQMRSISMAGLAVSIILFLATARSLIQQRELVFLAIEVIWIMVFGLLIFANKEARSKRVKFANIQRHFHKHIGLYLLLIFTSFLFIDADAVQFKWDGLLYYTACRDLTLGSISNLAIYGHIAQSYGALVRLMILVTDNVAMAMMAVNIMLLLFGICSFYGILKIVIKNKSEWQYLILTAIFGWSPFLLGMVYYHNLDFACQCLFPGVIYCLYKRRWVYFTAFSLLFCFTKEPAIIVYGAMCAGTAACDFINDREFQYIVRIKRLFAKKEYYLMVVPGVIWIVVYRLLGPWSAGDGGFVFEPGYIVNKLKVLYVLNFNWIFLLMCISGVAYLLYTKKMKDVYFLIPVFCSHMAFTVFSCLFKTVNHPRYNDTNQVTLYLIALVMSLYFCKGIVAWVLHGVIVVMLLVSCFKTIDPLSRLCFSKYNIGSDIMVTTMETPLGDGMIYNRQMLGLEKVLGLALSDALEDSNIVLFPALDNNAYFFDGMALVGEIVDGFRKDTEYWDAIQKKRMPIENEKVRIFDVYQITEEINWDLLEERIKGKVNLLYLSFAGGEFANALAERYEVVEEKEYLYRGWQMNRIEVIINE